MGTWTLDDVPWDRFDISKVDPEIISIVKAASVVEYNADDYRQYLKNVFAGDERACKAIDQWALEEVQHGQALGRWSELADPEFSFERAFRRFTDNYNIPVSVTESVRGSRAGELVTRCMVETGTNSLYSALADATDEPVLKDICRRIAEDEFAHYCMFHAYMCRYLKTEGIGFRERLRIAFQRTAETEDDELACAYWAANRHGQHFHRRSSSVAYAHGALKYYKPVHIARGVEMIFGALGLDPAGPLGWMATRAVRSFIWYRGRLCPRLAVWSARLSADWSPEPIADQRITSR